MTRRPQARLTALVLALAVLTAGCAVSLSRRLALASEQLAVSTERVQLEVIALHDRQLLTDDAYRAWQINFGRMAKTGLALNQAIRDGAGEDAAVQIRAMVDLVDELLRQDVVRVPQEHRLTVVLALESVRAVLLSLSVAVEE